MKILKAQVPWKDSFQELVDLWVERGYCESGLSNDHFSWVEKEGNILLYEHDRAERLPDSWKLALFANAYHDSPTSSRWIYWGRFPRNMEKALDLYGRAKESERDIESLFLGKIENPIQFVNRKKYDWSNSVELFSCPTDMGGQNKHPYTSMEYLQMVSRSKFGLCLAGYGPKCQREIELMSFGTVPIVTEGVCTQYFDPLMEGIHYLKADTPDQVQTVIKSCPRTKWKNMSENCIRWYERNCSIRGSFNTTVGIIYAKGFSSYCQLPE